MTAEQTAADVSCNRCGFVWQDGDPRKQVSCPVCPAGVGQPCQRPSGHDCAIHALRNKKAMVADAVSNCPCVSENQSDDQGQAKLSDQWGDSP